jgi:hypothetical protein
MPADADTHEPSTLLVMGLFWDILQHSQIRKQQNRSDSLEARLETLEGELTATRELLHTLVQRLETHFGEDLNRDGKIG